MRHAADRRGATASRLVEATIQIASHGMDRGGPRRTTQLCGCSVRDWAGGSLAAGLGVVGQPNHTTSH